jgi:protein phosphatase
MLVTILSPQREGAMADQPHRPSDRDLDIYGTTHKGLVRKTNEDHFLACSFRKTIDVHFTNLPDLSRFEDVGERLGFLAVVADGVGGAEGGGVASRRTLEALVYYTLTGVQTYMANEPHLEDQFLNELRESVLKAHEDLLAQSEGLIRGMKTTLTMAMTRWPVGYIVQVGDSRCYGLRDGELTQLTRDQTVAQELADAGVGRMSALRGKWGDVLSSSIGGSSVDIVISKVDMQWDDVYLLCSDGLTKHVPDDRIREILADNETAKDAAEALVQAALDGGGTDNITVFVGAVRRRQS